MSSLGEDQDLASRAPGPAGRAEIALQGIYEISKILAVPGRLDAVLSHVLAVLASFFDLRRGLIALIDEAGQPTSAVGIGWRDGEAKGHFASLPEKVVGRIVATKMPVIVEDVARDSLFLGWQADKVDGGRRVGFIGVPIKHRGQVIGTLIIDRIHNGDASIEEDARFLAMIANMVGQTHHL